MRLFSLVAFCLIICLQAQSQGIEFFHGSFEEALEIAKTEDKVIFVDAFTTWCGPCKRMSKTVFTQPEVGAFYNENFVNLKIDMEKPAGRQFQIKYPVSAYPTLYFIGSDGKVALKVKGAQQAEKFIELGRSAIGKVDKSGDFAAEYEEGNRDYDLVYKYVKALNKAGKPSTKISNDYLDSQKDLTTAENLNFILEATTEADSRIFDLLITHKSKIEAIVSPQLVQKKIASACKKTAEKAIEFEMVELLEESAAKMKKHCPVEASEFETRESMKYYHATGDSKNYLKTCMTHVKKNVKDDAKKLNELALEIDSKFDSDPKCMAFAEKIAAKSAQNGGLYHYYYTYASILDKNGKKSDALKNANKAMKLAKGDKRAEINVERLIQRIET